MNPERQERERLERGIRRQARGETADMAQIASLQQQLRQRPLVAGLMARLEQEQEALELHPIDDDLQPIIETGRSLGISVPNVTRSIGGMLYLLFTMLTNIPVVIWRSRVPHTIFSLLLFIIKACLFPIRFLMRTGLGQIILILFIAVLYQIRPFRILIDMFLTTVIFIWNHSPDLGIETAIITLINNLQEMSVRFFISAIGDPLFQSVVNWIRTFFTQIMGTSIRETAQELLPGMIRDTAQELLPGMIRDTAQDLLPGMIRDTAQETARILMPEIQQNFQMIMRELVPSISNEVSNRMMPQIFHVLSRLEGIQATLAVVEILNSNGVQLLGEVAENTQLARVGLEALSNGVATNGENIVELAGAVNQLLYTIPANNPIIQQLQTMGVSTFLTQLSTWAVEYGPQMIANGVGLLTNVGGKRLSKRKYKIKNNKTHLKNKRKRNTKHKIFRSKIYRKKSRK